MSSKESSINNPKKKTLALRKGYTTGACAAAAAKAATIVLLRQEPVNSIKVSLTSTNEVDFKIDQCVFDYDRASCCVIKDAGDDPDITNGAEIWATVSRKDTPGITIAGGKGVGKVTRPGLETEVGTDAINPAPRRMIKHAMNQAANKLQNPGLEVIISVPRGEELSRKTLNPRLGIVGGISILGTTGIVIPYSIRAYKACISQAVNVAAASGFGQIVLTTGRRSEKFAQSKLSLPEECFIQAGDFIGYTLKQCVRKHIPEAIIWGMTGKTSKLAAGHLYTHISNSRVDIGFLAELAADCGVPDDIVKTLQTAVTANHVRRMIPPEYSTTFCNRICRLAATKCREETGNLIEVECIMSSYDGTILGRANAEE